MPHLVEDSNNDHIDLVDVIDIVDALVQPAHQIHAGLHLGPRRHCALGRLRAMRSNDCMPCMQSKSILLSTRRTGAHRCGRTIQTMAKFQDARFAER